MSENTIVVIDGPAGAGKSTIAKRVAKELGFAFMDTGAMYRAVTLKALRLGIILEDEEALVQLVKKTKVDLINEPGLPMKVILDGEDVSQDIRSLEVTNKTFYIARASAVRQVMLAWQRQMGHQQSLVGEGRDLGTVVFPRATFKFYLDADFQVRCQRRMDELKNKGIAFDEQMLRKDLQERDEKDFTRKVGPLKKADDAIIIDSTSMSIDDVVWDIVRRVKS